jgi:hypothetical protein
MFTSGMRDLLSCCLELADDYPNAFAFMLRYVYVVDFVDEPLDDLVNIWELTKPDADRHFLARFTHLLASGMLDDMPY